VTKGCSDLFRESLRVGPFCGMDCRHQYNEVHKKDVLPAIAKTCSLKTSPFSIACEF
jgi:hypothetical protein